MDSEVKRFKCEDKPKSSEFNFQEADILLRPRNRGHVELQLDGGRNIINFTGLQRLERHKETKDEQGEKRRGADKRTERRGIGRGKVRVPSNRRARTVIRRFGPNSNEHKEANIILVQRRRVGCDELHQ